MPKPRTIAFWLPAACGLLACEPEPRVKVGDLERAKDTGSGGAAAADSRDETQSAGEGSEAGAPNRNDPENTSAQAGAQNLSPAVTLEQEFENYDLLLWSPRVRALAIGASTSDSLIAVSEELEVGSSRVAVHRVPAHEFVEIPPDLSQPWLAIPVPSERAPGVVSVAPLGEGAALYYRLPGSDAHAFGRFDADGQPLGAMNAENLPELREGQSNDGCTLVPDGDLVWVACGTSHITVRSCPLTGACSEELDVDTVSRHMGPPAVLPEAASIQVLYEDSDDGVHLRRSWVDRETLSVVSQERLAAVSGDEPSAPAALRVADGTLVAYGSPTRLGVWDDAGDLVRSWSASPPDDPYWTDNQRFSGWALTEQAAFVLVSRAYGQLDQSGVFTSLLRVDPLDLAEPDVLELPGPSALFAAPPGLLSAGTDSVEYRPLGADELESIEPLDVGGHRGSSPQNLACDDRGCALGMSDQTVFLIDREASTVRGPKNLGVATDAWPLEFTKREAVYGWDLADGGAELLVVDLDTGEQQRHELPSRETSAVFLEGEGFRVFTYTDTVGTYLHGVVSEGSLGELQAVSQGYPDRTRSCGTHYAAYDNVDGAPHLFRFDPEKDEDFLDSGRLGVRDTGFWACSEDAAFFIQESFHPDTGAVAHFIDVVSSDGKKVTSIGVPEGWELDGFETVPEADRLYSLWSNPDEPLDLRLVWVDVDGHQGSYGLPLPEARSTGISAAAVLDVDEGEARIAWFSQEGEVKLTIWPLPD